MFFLKIAENNFIPVEDLEVISKKSYNSLSFSGVTGFVKKVTSIKHLIAYDFSDNTCYEVEKAVIKNFGTKENPFYQIIASFVRNFDNDEILVETEE